MFKDIFTLVTSSRYKFNEQKNKQKKDLFSTTDKMYLKVNINDSTR